MAKMVDVNLTHESQNQLSSRWVEDSRWQVFVFGPVRGRTWWLLLLLLQMGNVKIWWLHSAMIIKQGLKWSEWAPERKCRKLLFIAYKPMTVPKQPGAINRAAPRESTQSSGSQPASQYFTHFIQTRSCESWWNLLAKWFLGLHELPQSLHSWSPTPKKLFSLFPRFSHWPVNLINIRTNSERRGQSVNAENDYHTFLWVALPLHWAEQERRRAGDHRVYRGGGGGFKRTMALCIAWKPVKHNQSSTQYRNMPAVKLFTYPQNDSGVGNKCKSMSREGEI